MEIVFTRPMTAIYNKFAINFHEMEHSKTQSLVNPNKAGDCEDSFFWGCGGGGSGGVNLTTPSYFKKNLSNINITLYYY